MNTNSIESRNRGSSLMRRCAVLAAALALTAVVRSAAAGGIEQIGSLRVVRVSGSHREMGIAHGKLLGANIVADLQDMIRVTYQGDDAAERYEENLRVLSGLIVMPDWAREEIEGIFEGMKSGDGTPPAMRLFDRRLKVEDLLMYNAGDVTRAFACSGFAVWGERAGEAGVIAGRNFDYTAFSKRVVEDQIMLVREPTGKRRVATITWPGYIGAFTGFNDDGAVAYLHDGNGPSKPGTDGQYVPVTLVLADVLASADSGGAIAATKTALADIATPFSYIVRVAGKRGAAGRGVPSAVFAIDANGLKEFEQRDGMCITTNHYLAGDGEVSESSKRRYRAVEESLGSGVVTSESAWASLRAAAVAGPAGGTLHSIVVYPETGRVELATATMDGALKAATNGTLVTIGFDRLFPSGR